MTESKLSRFGAYRIQIEGEKLTARKLTATKSGVGCLTAVTCFFLSYVGLLGAALAGRSMPWLAYGSFLLGLFGFALLLWSFMRSSRKVVFSIDRAKNEVQVGELPSSRMDRLTSVIVESREAIVSGPASSIHKEQMAVHLEEPGVRHEIAVLAQRSDANRLADAVAEFLRLPVTFEQGPAVHVAGTLLDD